MSNQKNSSRKPPKSLEQLLESLNTGKQWCFTAICNCSDALANCDAMDEDSYALLDLARQELTLLSSEIKSQIHEYERLK